MKALIIICAVAMLYNCTPLRSADNISASSFKELEAKARDNGENNPLRTTSRRRGGGSSGGSSGGTGGGGQPILGTFCSDCQALVTCLEDATTSTPNLLKGWYYFCPTESDFCLELVEWATMQLPENKFREWLKHQRSRDQKMPDVASVTDLQSPSRGFGFHGVLYTCLNTAQTDMQTRDTGCATTHTGDQTAIDTCKANSKKTYFVDDYQCWSGYYEHRSDFFCD